MNERIKKVIAEFRSLDINALLIMKDVNVSYLTEFPSSESWLLVTSKKTFYITDFRYILEAKKGLKGVSVVQYQHSLPTTLFDLLKKLKIKRFGMDEGSISLLQFKKLKKNCPRSIRIVAANGLVEKLREVKEKNELKSIQKALHVHALALQYLKRIIKPGLSEREVFNKLDRFVKGKRVRFSFEPIIAAGANSCYPHAKITDRRIRNNEPVLVDMGIEAEGYKSDLTRMFFLGKISDLVSRVNAIVRRAQQEAIKIIKPGIPVSEVDQAARNFLNQYKLGKYFGHALGHGVGLEIHESPRIAQKNYLALKEGMVVTIEPAVYIPHKFGIRLEDMVLVTRKGHKILSGRID